MTKLNGNYLITKLSQPIIFIVIGVLARVLPHPANFTPIAAMALFGGTYLSKKQALIIPIAAMIVSDVFIGFDSILMRLTVYGCFIVSVAIGIWIKNHKSAKTVTFGALLSSSLFFVVTNFTVWAFGSMYPKNLTGIFECYLYAIPFFKNTILGDMFYSGIFFGGYEFAKNLIQKKSSILES